MKSDWSSQCVNVDAHTLLLKGESFHNSMCRVTSVSLSHGSLHTLGTFDEILMFERKYLRPVDRKSEAGTW